MEICDDASLGCVGGVGVVVVEVVVVEVGEVVVVEVGEVIFEGGWGCGGGCFCC